MVTAPQATAEEINRAFSSEHWAAAFSVLADDAWDLF